MTAMTKKLKGAARELDRRSRFLARKIEEAESRGNGAAPERDEQRAILAAMESLDRERWREPQHEPLPADLSARLIAKLRDGSFACLKVTGPGMFNCQCGCGRSITADAIRLWTFSPTPHRQ